MRREISIPPHPRCTPKLTNRQVMTRKIELEKPQIFSEEKRIALLFGRKRNAEKTKSNVREVEVERSSTG